MKSLDSVAALAVDLELPIALDSSGFIAYLRNEEPLAEVVAPIVESDVLSIIISSLTLSEALVRTAELFGRTRVELVVESVQRLEAVRIVPFDQELAIEAAIVRAETRLKLPDAAIVATARIAGAIAIVGNDRAWQNKSLGIEYIHLDDVVREQEKEEETR